MEIIKPKVDTRTEAEKIAAQKIIDDILNSEQAKTQNAQQDDQDWVKKWKTEVTKPTDGENKKNE